jgi:hypothetical protein
VNPSIDDRLASIIRALTDIVLPGLAEDASLAREQLTLAVGHLSILRRHIEAMTAFETAELDDANQLATALLAVAEGGSGTGSAKRELEAILAQAREGEHVRETRKRVNAATERLVHEMLVDGSETCRKRLPHILIPQQASRSLKDRRWFALMGFDSELSAAT